MGKMVLKKEVYLIYKGDLLVEIFDDWKSALFYALHERIINGDVCSIEGRRIAERIKFETLVSDISVYLDIPRYKAREKIKKQFLKNQIDYLPVKI